MRINAYIYTRTCKYAYICTRIHTHAYAYTCPRIYPHTYLRRQAAGLDLVLAQDLIDGVGVDNPVHARCVLRALAHPSIRRGPAHLLTGDAYGVNSLKSALVSAPRSECFVKTLQEVLFAMW